MKDKRRLGIKKIATSLIPSHIHSPRTMNKTQPLKPHITPSAVINVLLIPIPIPPDPNHHLRAIIVIILCRVVSIRGRDPTLSPPAINRVVVVVAVLSVFPKDFIELVHVHLELRVGKVLDFVAFGVEVSEGVAIGDVSHLYLVDH